MYGWSLRIALLAALMLGGWHPPEGCAEEPGLEALDEATDAKQSARNLNDLTNVINQLQSALNKGLNESNREFAEELLAGTLMERVAVIVDALLKDRIPGDGRANIQLWNIAVSDLRRVIKLRPEDGEPQFLLGRLHLYANNREDAKSALDACVAAAHTSAAVKAKALALRAGLQDSEEDQLADVNQASELAPDDPEVLRTRGLYLLSRGKLDEAVADLNRSLEIEPDDAATLQAQGMALFGQEKLDAALESFAKVLEIAPDLRAARWYRARVFREKGDYAKALAEWDELLKKKPDDLAALAQRAEIHFEMDDFQSALADADAILEIRDHYVPALILRAEALAQLERIDEAIQSLAGSADKVSDQKNLLLLQLARYYLVDQRAGQAIETLDQLLAEDQDNWLALRIRGDALLAVGKQAAAIENYEAALQRRPEDSSTLNNLAWVLATSPDGQLRDGPRAVELATKACEATDYREPHILSTLAAAYAENGKFESAIRWSEKAVELGKQAKDEPHPQLDQLTAELAHYREGKPWRERQSQRPPESEEPSRAPPPEEPAETTVAPSPESKVSDPTNPTESTPQPPDGSQQRATGDESQ